MRFERFSTFADMVAFAVKTAAAYAPGSVQTDYSAYAEDCTARPQVLLVIDGAETAALRWAAFHNETGFDVDYLGKRQRVEACDKARELAAAMQAALDEAAAVDLRRAPFEELGETFPQDGSRVP